MSSIGSASTRKPRAIDCNPTNFDELLGDDQKTWFFNSSVAEQTNVWLGGYHSMLRKMGVTKYNFFLDKMIYGRTDWLKQPWNVMAPVPIIFPSLCTLIRLETYLCSGFHEIKMLRKLLLCS
jgi:hypothetical protein